MCVYRRKREKMRERKKMRDREREILPDNK